MNEGSINNLVYAGDNGQPSQYSIDVAKFLQGLLQPPRCAPISVKVNKNQNDTKLWSVEARIF